jgi:hypothetical protein
MFLTVKGNIWIKEHIWKPYANKDVFVVVALCSLVETDRRFRDDYCRHLQGALMIEAVSTSEISVSSYEAI